GLQAADNNIVDPLTRRVHLDIACYLALLRVASPRRADCGHRPLPLDPAGHARVAAVRKIEGWGPVGRLLIWFSGAAPRILTRCPTERPKYIGIGATIVTTSIFAAISMTFALNTDLQVTLGLAIFFAVI